MYYQTVSTFLFPPKKIISDKMLIHTRMGAFSMNFFSFASEKKPRNHTVVYNIFFLPNHTYLKDFTFFNKQEIFEDIIAHVPFLASFSFSL